MMELQFMDRLNVKKDAYQSMKGIGTRISRVIQIKDLRDEMNKDIAYLERLVVNSTSDFLNQLFEDYLEFMDEVNSYLLSEYKKGIEEA